MQEGERLRQITIIGGGLAGLATGLFLRRSGVPVCLHEAASYPRHKVCGEFLSPRDPEFLKQAGLEMLLDGAGRARSVVWCWGQDSTHAFELPHPACTLSRYEMDQRLARAYVEAGGELIQGSRKRMDAVEGVLIAAGRQVGPAEWIGLKAHYEGIELKADLEMHVGQGAYVGLCRVEGGKVDVCGLFRSEKIRGGKERLLQRIAAEFGLHALAERLVRAREELDSVCAVSGLCFGRNTSLRADVAAVGDAWATIPPFTGNGMSMALEGARIAAAWLEKYSREELEWAEMCRAINLGMDETFASRIRHAEWLHACLTRPFLTACAAGFSRTGLMPWRTLFGGLG